MTGKSRAAASLFLCLCGMMITATASPFATAPTDFYKNCKAAVIYTTDDGYNLKPGQPSLKKMFYDKYGAVLTHYVWTGTPATNDPIGSAGMPTWADLQALNDLGFEIGTHTRTHANLQDISLAQVRDEICGSRQDLISHIQGWDTLYGTVCYPYGSWNDNVHTIDKECYPRGAGFRCDGELITGGTSGTSNGILRHVESDLPFDGLGRVAIDDGSGNDTRLNALVDNAIANHSATVFYFHFPPDTSYISANLRYMNSKPEVWWGMTAATFIQYVYLREDATIQSVSQTTSSATMKVVSTNGHRYTLKSFTVKTEVPAGWNAAKISQAGHADSSVTVDKTTATHYAVYNVEPFKEFTITSTSTVVTHCEISRRALSEKNAGAAQYDLHGKRLAGIASSNGIFIRKFENRTAVVSRIGSR